MKATVVSKKGISMMGLLGVVLVTLKALGLVSISWLWATSPFWLGLAIIISILTLGVILTLIGALIFALFSR